MPVKDTRCCSKEVPRTQTFVIRIRSLDAACVMYATFLLLCPGCRRDPPDLTACTRVEVHYTHYTQGAIDYFFGWTPMLERVLFTFDNHDPKGGCVLLNDGTVWFIRTEEKLKQLRWE